MKRFNKSRLVKAALLSVAAVMIVACTPNDVTDPLGVGNFSRNGLTSLTNTDGVEKSTFYTYETILLSVQGLIPLEQTNIEVISGCPDCKNTIKRAVVVTDRDGKIINLPIWHNIGVDHDGHVVDQSDSYCVLITQPPRHDPWSRYEVCIDVLNDISPDPQVHVVDASGVFKGQKAEIGEDVYVRGYNLTPGAVKLVVVADEKEYAEGEPLTDVSGGEEDAVVAADGSLATSLVWAAAAAAGNYDIVVDTAPFGVYNDGDVVSQKILAGLTVQEPPAAQDIITDVACDAGGVFVNTFDELDPVFAKVIPPVTPGDLLSWESPIPSFVPVYVMPHKDSWTTGDRLVTIRTVGTHQMPSYCQINPQSGAVPLFRLRGETKPGYYKPLRLWPNDYDVIVDVNRNRLYDAGIDFLDGGPQVGFSVTANDTCPDVRLIASADEDIIGRSFADPRVWAHLVRADNSPIVGIPVKFSVVIGPGRVLENTDVTGPDGIAGTTVTNLAINQLSRVRIEALVDGKIYYEVVSFYRTLPCTHDQGHNQGHNQGFVSGP